MEYTFGATFTASMPLTLSDFDYDLPADLIAQLPPTERGRSRLLNVSADGGLVDQTISAYASHLRAGDVLVFNDTKVIPARIFGHKATGGSVEILIERVLGEGTALAHVRASKSPKPGSTIIVSAELTLNVLDRREALFLLQFPAGKTVLNWLHDAGKLPLPPYITHAPDAHDEARYQTVYAKTEGAVAAPTAGLHFTEEMLGHIDALGVTRAHVTLHVGAGTFQPVRSEELSAHIMHSEWYDIAPKVQNTIISAKNEGRRVIAVGTTSLRALESAATGPSALQAGARETTLFITPGYTFNIVDALLTNFHLPKSTLLMLVSAFAGTDVIRAAYAHAIAQRYQFFSYGDAMFLRRQTKSPLPPGEG